MKIVAQFSKTTRTYSTRERAVVEVIKDYKDVSGLICVIASEDGRYSPVFVLNSDTMYLANELASRGFHCISA